MIKRERQCHLSIRVNIIYKIKDKKVHLIDLNRLNKSKPNRSLNWREELRYALTGLNKLGKYN
jgi:hypothetical protein